MRRIEPGHDEKGERWWHFPDRMTVEGARGLRVGGYHEGMANRIPLSQRVGDAPAAGPAGDVPSRDPADAPGERGAGR